jgi:hypothetical protein
MILESNMDEGSVKLMKEYMELKKENKILSEISQHNKHN